MSKTLKTLMAAGAVATSLTLAPASAMADAPEASAGVANLYLFRGQDLGDGNATLFGDLTWGLGGGVSASVWVSSEGNDSGGEVDFILGWGGEIGGVEVGAGAVNYYYPGANDSSGSTSDDGTTGDSFGDFSEIYLTAGMGGAEVSYWKNVAGDIGYQYYTLGYSHGAYSLLLGMKDFDDSTGTTKTENSYTHIDLNYAATDRLSFTVSKTIDRDSEVNGMSAKDRGDENSLLTSEVGDDDVLFVVSYTLPIDLK